MGGVGGEVGRFPATAGAETCCTPPAHARLYPGGIQPHERPWPRNKSVLVRLRRR
jgi:hypothetical protein